MSDMIEASEGVPFSFGIKSEPAFDGSEVLLCAIKATSARGAVPDASEPTLVTATPRWDAANATWFFDVSAAQSALLPAGLYVTDIRMLEAGAPVWQSGPMTINMRSVVSA